MEGCQMGELIIHIPDDIVRQLEGIAAAQKKSVEQVALERLSGVAERAGSPGAVLRAMKELPHVSPTDVDELDAAIASGRLPVSDQGVFDR
jgi:hypothetical protein